MKFSSAVGIFACMKADANTYEIPQQERCLCCGEKIDYRQYRTDRKFCCDRCKNAYHNRMRAHYADVKLKVDGIIEVNYRLLNEMLKLGVTQVSMAEAVAMGFKPQYSTSVSKTRTCMEYCCYDIAYRVSDIRIFNIHRLALTLREIKKL